MPDEPHQLTPEHVAAIDAAVRATSPAEAPSGILYHPMFHTLDGGRFTSGAAVEVALAELRQIVWELSRSALHAGPVADLEVLDEATAAAIREQVVPMAVLDCRFEAVTERAMRRFVATIARGGDLDLADADRAELLETRRVSLCRPLVESVPDGERVAFSFDAAWQVSNSGEQPVEIVFDPGDGKGPRSVPPGAQVEAGYDSTGSKTLTVTLRFADGRETTTVAPFRVRALSLPKPSWRIPLVQGSHGAEVASGSVCGYYADGRGRMAKPLFLWTGFKTQATLGGQALVEHWAATAEDCFADPDIRKLLEECRKARWDIVIIDIHDTKKSIQANAAMVREAIKKVTLLTRAPREPGAILTGSMGGLIARYALTWMQRDDPPQHIAKAIFFDSPFKGAVIPMSVQYAIDFFALVNTEAETRRERYLNALSAQQMLVQLFDPHWHQQDHPQPRRPFKELDGEFTVLGWPRDTDCYVATSGSGERRGQRKDDGTTLAPEDLMIFAEHWEALVLWKASAWLHAAPDAVQRRSSAFKSTAVGHPGRRWQAYVSQTPPWDSCPGGFYDSVKQFAEARQWSTLQLHASNSCFIPTLSAINIDPGPDPYRAPPSVTPKPFKDVYMPAENTRHCELTPEVTKWIKKILLVP